jgi:hypothetical protein
MSVVRRDANGRALELHPAMRANMWKKGQAPNPTGKSGRYGEMQKICRDFSPEAAKLLVDIALDPTEDTRCRIVAIQELHNRGWGKPRDYDPTKEEVTGVSVFDPASVPPEQLELIRQAMLVLANAMTVVEVGRR